MYIDGAVGMYNKNVRKVPASVLEGNAFSSPLESKGFDHGVSNDLPLGMPAAKHKLYIYIYIYEYSDIYIYEYIDICHGHAHAFVP